MKNKLLIYSIILFITYIGGMKQAFSMNMFEFLSGEHYTQKNYTSRFLHVTFLKDGYTLEKRPELDPELTDAIAPPYETCVRAYIVKNNKIIKKINTINDFRGFIHIDSVEKAIELVRLRTSGHTYFLFRPDILVEVFKQANNNSKNNWMLGEESNDFFEKYRLKNLRIEKKKGFFEIKRYVIYFPWPGAKEYPSPPILYLITEKVFEDGRYTFDKTKIMKGVEVKNLPHPL
jgi:hypothetical protein